MNESALILRDDSRRSVAMTSRAMELKAQALEQSALIGRVTNEEEQRLAVIAQTSLAELLSAVEKARKAAKDPVLAYGRSIDDAAKSFRLELEEDEVRVARMVGDYQKLLEQRARAAQAAENERLQALERERAKELAQATDLNQVDAIQEKFNNRAAQEAIAPPPAPRVEGQRITQDWDVCVTDVWLLAKAHPMCVHVEPRLSEIKSLLNAGVKVAGVRAERVTKAGIRLSPRAKAIEV